MRNIIKTSENNVSFNKSNKGRYVEGEVLVKYKSSKVNLKSLAGSVKSFINEGKYKLSKKDEIKDLNVRIYKSDKPTEVLISELKTNPDVEYVEPNYIYKASSIPNDTDFLKLWGLNNTGQAVNGNTGINDKDIDAPEAWDLESSSQPEVIVAVIDSGIAYDHPDLAANMWQGSSCKDENNNLIAGGCPNNGWDFYNNDNNPYDDYMHGTHIAGIIAATANNSTGVTGISSKNKIKIMALKAGDYEGNMSLGDIINAIYFAKNNNVKVINASFGGPGYSALLKQAIENFPGIVVAAAGNGGDDEIGDNNDASPIYPASFDSSNIISVAATSQSDDLTKFSNYGPGSVDVAAPGSNIYSTVPAFEYPYFEDFDNVITPDIPSGFTSTDSWATYYWNNTVGNVLFTDYNTPYTTNANAVLTSPTINLTGSKTA
ncbi:MAG: S8 family serine peptidase, partial [Candidatus Aenigmarchaeota archaeon]|nr:S8 family serine peptidase [Candidatus Aenigmarchaeota archaeon]